MEVLQRIMEFLVSDLTRENKGKFTVDEIEDIIDFYREHPALWNHSLQEYRDRALRESLMSKLCNQFEGKYPVNEMGNDNQSFQLSAPPPSKKQREQKTSEEKNTKTDLWKALTQSISQKTDSSSSLNRPSSSTNKSDLARRAEIF